jgi:O-antigen biosynthesis protein
MQPKQTKIRSFLRPEVRGNFIFYGNQKLFIRGVTYGTFAPDEHGNPFPRPEVVRHDFRTMMQNGINAVRTYAVPPTWLLDLALENHLWVMVGIPWEQHITFLDDRTIERKVVERVVAVVAQNSGHPAVLCYSIGNEIPASIVRWHGSKKIERFLYTLYKQGKRVDPEALFTYVNYPTTEYLQLPFLDIVSFNVYLESKDILEAYLYRLQNLAHEKPLLMAEIGLDSLRNGPEKQAEVLSWQIESSFAAGCAGTFVFAWTDEWYRGGAEIEDWDFGLTTRDREPKPALSAVREAYRQVPFRADLQWPKISVVVCSYNGSATIRDTMESMKALLYPNFEVIVVNDGSSDETKDIVSEYDVRLISTENRGLSNARNTGYKAATGEIIAYLDDDAYADPHWLHYLAHTYLTTDFVGVGGPNIAPAGDGPIADCVANAPGGPVHVLVTDRVAEHIAGCNMSFRKSALQAVGGFDPRYRTAGDDVDACWRVQDQVGNIGFHPTALVWHHRRNAWSTYWKQQKGYGKAEALLEEKWPEKYNAFGHTSWQGRLYGKGWTVNLGILRPKIYHGIWGNAPFQTLYQPHPSTILSLPLMPEWYFVVAILVLFSLFGMVWNALYLLALPLLVMSIAPPLAQAVISASRARFTSNPDTTWRRVKLFGITALMHLQQPLARLIGRVQHGLTPWRKRPALPQGRMLRLFPEFFSVWRERWEDPQTTLRKLQHVLQEEGAPVEIAGDYDSWDLEIRDGLWGRACLKMATEEHGQGKQLAKFRIFPKFSMTSIMLLSIFAVFTLLLLFQKKLISAVIIGSLTVLLAVKILVGVSRAFSYFDDLKTYYESKKRYLPDVESPVMTRFQECLRDTAEWNA